MTLQFCYRDISRYVLFVTCYDFRHVNRHPNNLFGRESQLLNVVFACYVLIHVLCLTLFLLVQLLGYALSPLPPLHLVFCTGSILPLLRRKSCHKSDQENISERLSSIVIRKANVSPHIDRKIRAKHVKLQPLSYLIGLRSNNVRS